MARSLVITGNWKMYKTIEEAVLYIENLVPLVKESKNAIYLAVPFTALKACSDAAKETNIVIGAQNMNDASEGAFTGEIAAPMLVDAGACFVILGHSERRHIFTESNEFINKKVKKAVAIGLQPVLCIGETLQNRESGEVEPALEQQLKKSLAGISSEDLAKMIIAYEPVWAVGTDHPATPEEAEEAHQIIRKIIARDWDPKVAEKIVIQYGGSVKPENAKAFLDRPDIDGLLVGGASLSPDMFSKIVNYQEVLVK